LLLVSIQGQTFILKSQTSIDLYGRGNSSSPSANHDILLFVEQTRELIEQVVGQTSKVILVGMSMGGAIASAFLVKYPQYVTKSIIMCPAGVRCPMPEITSFLSIPLIGWLGFKAVGKSAMIKLTRSERFAANFHQYDKVNKAGIIDELIEKVIWQIEQKDGFLDGFHSTICNFPFNGLLPEIKKISRDIPLLLMWGDQDQMCQGHDLYMEAVPHAELALMHGCGHAFIYEDVPQTEQYMLQFLNKYS